MARPKMDVQRDEQYERMRRNTKTYYLGEDRIFLVRELAKKFGMNSSELLRSVLDAHLDEYVTNKIEEAHAVGAQKMRRQFDKRKK